MLYRNGVKIDETEEYTRGKGVKKQTSFKFGDGDTITLKDEGRNAVIWLGSIRFHCGEGFSNVAEGGYEFVRTSPPASLKTTGRDERQIETLVFGNFANQRICTL